jgi:hypothetical protein
MKQLACGVAVAAILAFSVPGQAQTEAPAPIQPGSPPAAAQTQSAPPPTPYVVPTKTPPAAAKQHVRRKHRARSRVSSDNIANRLNAQELARGGMPGGMAGPPGYGGPGGPIAAAGPGYPPPMYRLPPPPFWYPPPRPLYWRPWWRPWGW